MIFVAIKALGGSGGGAFGRWGGLVLAGAGLAALYWFEPQITGSTGLASDTRRVIVLGLPAAAVVFGLLSMERAGWRTTSRLVLALGNASYALYLLHPLFFAVFLQMKPGATLQKVEMLVGLGLATAAFSWVFYRLVEAPLIRLLRRRLAHDPPPAVQT